jgi:hypothetical protein
VIRSTRALVRSILDQPFGHPWVLRGYGQLLRLYLTPDEKVCLHLWHPREPRPFEMHTHPFALDSYVVSGLVEQYRYVYDDDGDLFRRLVIPPPPARVSVDSTDSCRLERGPIEQYRRGDRYGQEPDEIHRTMPVMGAVTLLEWGGGDPVDAALFWPVEADAERPWEPRDHRKATDAEIARFVRVALAGWED